MEVKLLAIMDTSGKKFSFSRLFKIIAGLIAGYSFWFVMLVIALRWINPGFTSFTLQENWREFETDRYSLRAYWVPEEDIPTSMKWAVVASEDQRFYEHNGLDLRAIGKALQEKEEGERVRGASTISQQVSKNLFLWPGKSYFRKGVEAGITLLIEATWPKERILEVYLNIAEFGPGVYGIGKASEHFFAKPAMELTADESARMATVLPNPKRMKVEPPTPFVAKRKEWVLRNMMQLSGIAYVEPEPEKEPEPEIERNEYQDIITRAFYSDTRPKIWLSPRDSVAYTDSLDFN